MITMGQIQVKSPTYQTTLTDRKYLMEKETKNNGLLHFDFVDKKTTKKMIEENHYSKSWYHMMGKINVGVFKNDRLLGVASYGSMKVAKSFRSICKDIQQHEIVELNRLWIDDELKKNAESLLISKSIKLIKQYYPEIRIIQSFADGRLGCGTIYQASNFKYYGYHETEFFEDKESGRCFHEMVFHTSSRPLVITRNLEMLHNRFRKFKTRTYRYLYLIDKKLEIVHNEQEYVKEPPYKEYLDWEINLERVERWIQNCLKYQFVKLEKPQFRFTFDGDKYTYTKEMWENNIHPISLLS
tara:strand:- start:11815 stop:12708 length:894 start_codon:yes stop_codon:yes gene_type:complete